MTVVFAVVCFLLVQHLVIAVMTSAHRLYIKAEFDHADTFQLYYSNSKKHADFKEQDSERSQLIEAGKKTQAKIRLADSSTLSVRLDTGDQPGVVKIYSMDVRSHFVKPRVLLPEEIYNVFKPGKDDVHISLEKDHVRIVSQNEDPYIVAPNLLSDLIRFCLMPLQFCLPWLFRPFSIDLILLHFLHFTISFAKNRRPV